MTDDDLEKLRAITAAATPGPWYLAYATVHDQPRTQEFLRIERTIADDAPAAAYDALPDTSVCRVPVVAGDMPTAQGERDGEFIAAARTAMPRLLDEVSRLRESVACLNMARDDLARQLAAMTKARDAACDELEDTGTSTLRAAELREVGS